MKRIFVLMFTSAIILSGASMAFSQTTILQENFTTYQGTAATVPAGWIFTHNDYYNSTTYSGSSGPNSYKFSVDQATITTPYFASADSVHFRIKGSSVSTSSSLAVMEGADTTTMTTLATLIPLPSTGTTHVYHINSGTHYLRFVYTKSAGNLAFDDFLVTGNSVTQPKGNHIKIYFNNPVNTSVSSGTDAVYLNHLADDTLIAYINRAKYTIDVAIYDYIQSSGISNIATAINNAYNRGVAVRWIYDGSSSNSGLPLLNSNIHTLASPTSSNYGTMHNKFMIIDANSANADDAIVWTGSTNWDDGQMNTDVNNVIIFQDQPLAQAYTLEFNQMWGGTGLSPVPANEKFGPDKSDITPHTFTIDGKTVESYFSPSDGTNSHIQSTLNSANDDIFFGIYTFTDNSDATIIKNLIQNNGIYCAGIMDQYSNTYQPYSILNPVMGNMLKMYTQSNSIYHSKFVIVDACDPSSDPVTLTGSHNWTISANTKNDENTVIVHDATIANIYYQSFYQNFYDLGGTLRTCSTNGTDESTVITELINVYPNPSNGAFTVQIENSAIGEIKRVEIYDVYGKKVFEETDAKALSEEIHLNNIPEGIYLMKVKVGENICVQKIIIRE